MATRKETLKRKTALVQQIRREYKNGELLPGEMLPPVRELADKFGLSKRVVNEELQKLATEGWIFTVPRKGIFVSGDAGVSPRFLDHAVVVLSGADRPSPAHRQSGWLDHVAYGALKEIHARGLHSIVLHPDRLCAEVLERLAPEQPYGVVVPEMNGEIMRDYGEVLREKGVRVVMNGGDPLISDFNRVASDQVKGAFELTRWMIEQGHKNVRLAWTIEPDLYWCSERQKGYKAAMKAAGLRPLADLKFDLVSNDAFENHVAALVAQLKPHFKNAATAPDALLVASDGSVAELDAALRELDKTPGQDVFVGGYDNYWQDLEACGYPRARPAVTIDKNNEEMGAEMVRLLLELNASENGQNAHRHTNSAAIRREVEPRLVVTDA